MAAFDQEVLLPFQHPFLNKLDLLLLSVCDGQWRQFRCCLVWEEPVLVPVMNCTLNKDERLASGRDSVTSAFFERVGCCRSPWVCRSVDECKTGIGYVVSTILVDSVDVGRACEIEGISANNTFIVNVVGSGDQGKLASWSSGPCLEETPFCTVLVRPQAPILREIILSIEG